MITATQQAIKQIARDIGRLRPDWRDPERYFHERDELERRLRRIAHRLDTHHG